MAIARCLALLCLLALALTPAAARAQAPLTLATTTSTDNTGFLDYIVPLFTKATGIPVRWLAVGTGKALALGRRCDVDVLLVHAPTAEQRFLEAGYGASRIEVMYNDFVLAGPRTDPAGARGGDILRALRAIAGSASLFLSRGDDSGTHKREVSLWRAALGRTAAGPWYRETGQGMMATLRMAGEQDAYTLTDRGTWIAYQAREKARSPLEVLVAGDKRLFNQYSVLLLSPEHCPDVRHDEARRFADYMASPEAQARIGAFRLQGEPLFVPNAKSGP